MRKRNKVGLLVVAVIGIIVATGLYLHHTTVAVLQPRGPVALKERNLLYLVLLLSLIVVIPVFTAAILFAVRYREGAKRRHVYAPNWDRNRLLEATWWLIPTVIIAVLAVITWQSTQALNPYKPLVASKPTMPIEVIALDWKWLFIYPNQNIATVNYADIPTGTPVDFEITADAPMNSFWLPQLGGQIYAMPGMESQLNLMASQNGSYHGVSANISGAGFAGMTFVAHAVSDQSFASWVASVQHGSKDLTKQAYTSLSQPSEYTAPASFASVKPALFEDVIMKYMVPSGVSNQYMEGMSMS